MPENHFIADGGIEIVDGESVEIPDVQGETEADLTYVVEALDAERRLLGVEEAGQEQRGEDRDDGKDHEEFDQVKPPRIRRARETAFMAGIDGLRPS